MKKKFIIILILFVVFITFIAGFSNSYISRRIEHLAYVLVLGIDKGEKARLKISIQFINVSSSSSGASSDSSQIVLTSCEANSMFSGLNLLNSYIGKEINLAHCSVVVFSEEIAKEGISSEIYSLINNEEIRSSANIVVANDGSVNVSYYPTWIKQMSDQKTDGQIKSEGKAPAATGNGK